MKELWCLDTADEGCKGGCEGAVVSRAVGGGCEVAVVPMASKWWM